MTATKIGLITTYLKNLGKKYRLVIFQYRKRKNLAIRIRITSSLNGMHHDVLVNCSSEENVFLTPHRGTKYFLEFN